MRDIVYYRNRLSVEIRARERAEEALDQFKYDIVAILNSAESYQDIGRRVETWWKSQNGGGE